MFEHVFHGVLGHLGDVELLLEHVEQVLVDVPVLALLLGLLEDAGGGRTGQRLLNARPLLLLDDFDVLGEGARGEAPEFKLPEAGHAQDRLSEFGKGQLCPLDVQDRVVWRLPIRLLLLLHQRLEDVDVILTRDDIGVDFLLLPEPHVLSVCQQPVRAPV